MTIQLPVLLTLDGALLMAFIQVCGVVGGCDDASLRSCVRQLESYERQVGDGIIFYTEWELDDLCRRYDDIGVCVRRATSTCSTDPASPSASFKKQLWSGISASFNFMCKNGKRTYLKHAQCLSTHPVQSSLRQCNRTFHMERTIFMEKRFAHNDENQQLCVITSRFLDCLFASVKKQCGSDAASWETNVVKQLRRPKLELLHGCTLGCSNLRHRLFCFVMTLVIVTDSMT